MIAVISALVVAIVGLGTGAALGGRLYRLAGWKFSSEIDHLVYAAGLGLGIIAFGVFVWEE